MKLSLSNVPMAFLPLSPKACGGSVVARRLAHTVGDFRSVGG